MNLFKDLKNVKSVFFDTAPIIYYIEANDRFGPLVKQVVELLSSQSVQVFTSVLTLAEVLPKPIETENSDLADKFARFLKDERNLTMLPITENIGESAGMLRGRYPHLKTVDAVQIAASLDANAEVFLTNDKRLSSITEIKVIVLIDYLNDASIIDRS